MNLDPSSLHPAGDKWASTSAACPVCRARLHGSESCFRCGADLRPLLLLSAHAFRMRETARTLLGQGDFRQALRCAEEAERLHATPQGALLLAVCSCLP